jgi:hypothetical protein
LAATTTPAPRAVPSRRELLDRLAPLLPHDDSFQLWVEELEHAHAARRHGRVGYDVKLGFGNAGEGRVSSKYKGRRR